MAKYKLCNVRQLKYFVNDFTVLTSLVWLKICLKPLSYRKVCITSTVHTYYIILLVLLGHLHVGWPTSPVNAPHSSLHKLSAATWIAVSLWLGTLYTWDKYWLNSSEKLLLIKFSATFIHLITHKAGNICSLGTVQLTSLVWCQPLFNVY